MSVSNASFEVLIFAKCLENEVLNLLQYLSFLRKRIGVKCVILDIFVELLSYDSKTTLMDERLRLNCIEVLE